MIWCNVLPAIFTAPNAFINCIKKEEIQIIIASITILMMIKKSQHLAKKVQSGWLASGCIYLVAATLLHCIPPSFEAKKKSWPLLEKYVMIIAS